MNKKGYVYILTNKTNKVLYVGVTSNIKYRIAEHREKTIEGFTSKYNVTKLVYLEGYETIEEAINREKQIKSGPRKMKIALIESLNSGYKDLFYELF